MMLKGSISVWEYLTGLQASLLSDYHHHHHHYHHHPSLYRESRWGTPDDFTTSFLHFPLFSTALWDLANSRPVQFLMLSSHLFFCLPCLLPPFYCALQDVYWPDLMNGRHVHTTAVCVSLRWPGGLRVVRLSARSGRNKTECKFSRESSSSGNEHYKNKQMTCLLPVKFFQLPDWRKSL